MNVYRQIEEMQARLDGLEELVAVSKAEKERDAVRLAELEGEVLLLRRTLSARTADSKD